MVRGELLAADLKAVENDAPAAVTIDDMKRLAYRYELEQIQEAYEEDRLSRIQARRLRENVQLMQMDLEDTV